MHPDRLLNNLTTNFILINFILITVGLLYFKRVFHESERPKFGFLMCILMMDGEETQIIRK